MSNETGDVWVILNGEIWNYKGLRKELIEKGVIPVESDFEKMGDDMTDEVHLKLLPLFVLSANSNHALDDGQCSPLPNG